jgi:uncharacterized membrane protein YfcA
MTPLAALLAILIGLTLGLLGGGGAILTVPALVYVVGVDPKVAVVMSLPIIGGAALIGAVQHWRLGHVELRSAIPFGLAAMSGAFAGARAARLISGTTQLLIFATVMTAAAVAMLRNESPPAVANPSRRRSPVLLAVGAATGVLTGLVGVGGGFLMVPALVILGGLEMSHAIGTSLLVIAMNTGAGYAGHVGGVVVPWLLVLWFFGFAVVGILAGGRLTSRVPQAALKRALAVLLFALSGFLFWQNLPLVFG